LPSKVNDSGTPERIETAVLGELALHDPMRFAGVAAPLAMGRAAYSAPIQDFVRALMTGGQNWRQPLAQGMRQIIPPAAMTAQRDIAQRPAPEDPGKALIRALLQK
jgi:hypothetical protein